MIPVPVGMSKDELLAVIDDIRAHIAADDSFEGYLNWSFPESDDADFGVQAGYRVGNSMGQGSFRMIGEFAPEPGDAP